MTARTYSPGHRDPAADGHVLVSVPPSRRSGAVLAEVTVSDDCTVRTLKQLLLGSTAPADDDDDAKELVHLLRVGDGDVDWKERMGVHDDTSGVALLEDDQNVRAACGSWPYTLHALPSLEPKKQMMLLELFLLGGRNLRTNFGLRPGAGIFSTGEGGGAYVEMSVEMDGQQHDLGVRTLEAAPGVDPSWGQLLSVRIPVATDPLFAPTLQLSVLDKRLGGLNTVTLGSATLYLRDWTPTSIDPTAAVPSPESSSTSRTRRTPSPQEIVRSQILSKLGDDPEQRKEVLRQLIDKAAARFAHDESTLSQLGRGQSP